MSIIARKQMPDGFVAITKGVNSGLAPNLLPRDQLSWAVNTTTRNMYPTHRPGYVKCDLRFVDETGAVDTALRDSFENGRFQGGAVFERRGMLVTSISGRLFSINVDMKSVQDVSIVGDLNPNDRPRAWFVEAEDFCIVQDGQSQPLIFDGASTRRSDTFGVSGKVEVPVGNVMAYALGRLWVVLPDRRSFVAGDIVYSSTGTASYGGRDAILRFTENEVIAEGFAFGVPFNAGNITAMVPIAQSDTSTGQGPLQVFTQRGAFSVNAPFDRTQWQTANFPIVSVSMTNNGAASDGGSINVNGDIWFRSTDGVRSFINTIREFSTWTNTAMSKEANRQLLADDPYLLEYTTAANFDNRLLMTCAGYRMPGRGVLFDGLLVLDFDPLGMIANRAQMPVWDGVWCGLRVFQIVRGLFNGVERCFMFVLGDTDKIEVWELTKDRRFDWNGTKDFLIQWELETPAYGFQSGGMSLKQLHYADIHYDELGDDTRIDVFYRPDQDPNWREWGSVTSCAKIESCSTECSTVPTLARQYRKRVRFPEISGNCDPISGMPDNFGYEFATRIQVTGDLRINKWRLWASDVPEETQGSCQSHV